MMAFGMYNGVVNTHFSIGNWKRGFKIETMTEDPDFQKVDFWNQLKQLGVVRPKLPNPARASALPS